MQILRAENYQKLQFQLISGRPGPACKPEKIKSNEFSWDEPQRNIRWI